MCNHQVGKFRQIRIEPKRKFFEKTCAKRAKMFKNVQKLYRNIQKLGANIQKYSTFLHPPARIVRNEQFAILSFEF
jgi:hypothetical protein